MTAGFSALQLERVKGGVRCCEPQCTRTGRYRIRIAGHYVEAESLVHRYALLCKSCAQVARALWDELSGVTRRRQVTAAVIALLGTRPEATDGIESLRELGYSKQQVLETRRAITGRGSVGEIVEGLVNCAQTDELTVSA